MICHDTSLAECPVFTEQMQGTKSVVIGTKEEVVTQAPATTTSALPATGERQTPPHTLFKIKAKSVLTYDLAGNLLKTKDSINFISWTPAFCGIHERSRVRKAKSNNSNLNQ